MILKNDPFTIEQEPMRNPFVGIPSFLMAPLCFDLDQLEADIAVIGMPYDLGTSVNTGARFGPRGVREASSYNCYAHEGWYDPIRKDLFGRAVENCRLRQRGCPAYRADPQLSKLRGGHSENPFQKSNPLCHWRRSRYYHADPARF